VTTPSIATALPSEFGRHVKNISRQSSVFLLGTLFSTAAGYFFKIYLARVLGAEALGIYALGMTAAGLAGIFAALGLPQTASRFVAVFATTSQPARLGRFLWSALFVLFAANVLVAAFLLSVRHLVAGPLYHTPALAGYMYWFALIMLTGSLTTFLGQALAGYKDVSRRTVITNFIGQSLTMAFSIALLTLGYGLNGYLAAQVASAVAVLFLLGWAVWKLTPESAREPALGHPLLEPEIVSYSAVLFGIQGLEFLTTQTDKIVLGIFLTARDVGIYAVATALVAFVAIFLQSLNQIFGPTIAELHSNQQHDLLLNLYQTSTKWVLGFTLPLAFVIMIFARPLMGIFGPQFSDGWPVLLVATLGQLVNCGVGSVGYLLLMSGQQRRMARNQGMVAGAIVVLNLLLIPRFGLVGAAAAAGIANSLMNLLMLRDVGRTLSLHLRGRSYLSLLLPALVTVTAIYSVRWALRGFHHDVVAVIAGLIAGYLAFFLAAITTGLDPADRMLARSAWNQISGILGLKVVARSMAP
jgi:O-antigen/teichoic acid export membrane protein